MEEGVYFEKLLKLNIFMFEYLKLLENSEIILGCFYFKNNIQKEMFLVTKIIFEVMFEFSNMRKIT